MKYLYLLRAIALTTVAPLAMAEETVMDTPNASVTLPFADSYASTFYTVDNDIFRVVIAFATASEENEKLIRQIVQLKDGQSYRLSIGGYGNETQATTITMTRKNARILVDVASCQSAVEMASCI
jgi:hypothetical protein